MTATAENAKARAAWEEARKLQEANAPIAVRRAALADVLAVAGDAHDAEYFRHACEERLLQLDLVDASSAADRKRIEQRWVALALDRIPHGRGIRALGVLTRALEMKKLPAKVAHAFSDAWAREVLQDMVALDPILDGSVSDRWRADVVPEDGLEAYRFARESFRRGAWSQVCACGDVVDRTKAEMSVAASSKAEAHRNTQDVRRMTKMMRVVAMHHLGTSNAPAARALIFDVLTLAARPPHDGGRYPWESLAALAIQHGLVDDPADAKVINALADAWRRHGAAPHPAVLRRR